MTRSQGTFRLRSETRYKGVHWSLRSRHSWRKQGFHVCAFALHLNSPATWLRKERASDFSEQELIVPGAPSVPGPSVRWCHLARGARQREPRGTGTGTAEAAAPQSTASSLSWFRHHGCRERKSQLLISPRFSSYWNLLKFQDKVLKKWNLEFHSHKGQWSSNSKCDGSGHGYGRKASWKTLGDLTA